MLRQCPGQGRAILRAGLDRRFKTAYILKAPLSPPIVFVIVVRIALAAVAQNGNDGALPSCLVHLAGQMQGGNEIRARLPAATPAQAGLQTAQRRQAGGIRDFYHAVHDRGDERQFYTGPAYTFYQGARLDFQLRIATGVSIEENGVLRVRYAYPAVVTLITYVAPYRRRSDARSAAAHNPGQNGMRLLPQLLENRLGDIVVGAPVRSSFSVGELIYVMPTQLARQAFGFPIDLSYRVHQMYLTIGRRE